MRRIIILDKIPNDAGDLHFRYALWLDVPAARQPFIAVNQAVFTSAVQGAVAPDATELALFTSGKLIERVEDARWAKATPLADIKQALVDRLATVQAEVNGDGANVWRRYGTSFDDTAATWNNKTVA